MTNNKLKLNFIVQVTKALEKDIRKLLIVIK